MKNEISSLINSKELRKSNSFFLMYQLMIFNNVGTLNIFLCVLHYFKIKVCLHEMCGFFYPVNVIIINLIYLRNTFLNFNQLKLFYEHQKLDFNSVKVSLLFYKKFQTIYS